MTRALVFWILMLVWLIFGCWANYPYNASTFHPLGISLLTFALFGLLGWQVFGPAIKS